MVTIAAVVTGLSWNCPATERRWSCTNRTILTLSSRRTEAICPAWFGKCATGSETTPQRCTPTAQMPWKLGSLPDPFVRLIPVLTHPFDQSTELRPEVVADRFTVLVIQVDGIQEFPVNI